MHQASAFRAACESGRGHHHNIRDLGAATVLPKSAEEDIVLWLNTHRKDGSPVSRVMLQLQAMHLAKEHGLEDTFAASPTWVKLFLRRHRLSLRARTRQGQTTPEDAQEAAKEFRTIVLKTIGERKCIQNILLLWDDFSGHWTTEVKDYAVSINVILLKVPPRYTYVCQPADISWNKPLKARLRAQWIECLRSQLVEYGAGEIRRKQQRVQLQHEIDRVRKELVQKEAGTEVEHLRALLTEEPFILTPPNRVDITEWISTSWGDLSIETEPGLTVL
ncbi:unnamed protein product [Phytophthora fragariaefolia]|uniref:Unnamed protein product n=1 Tax=Phytophthora fragariaefolia TaxID=1490495 RepID=A0A9W6YAN5_9STRA|nr:unnamed protein product [Phytophthora fragariaefolia]